MIKIPKTEAQLHSERLSTEARIARTLSIEDSHDRINDAIEAVALADRELAHAVFAARNNGCTWQTIGEDLGVSRAAAWNRFGSKFDTADD